MNLVSLKDGIDLSTPAGRLIANVLASVAAYETEVRSERIVAGQAVARANGKRWGGSVKGRRIKVEADQARIIRTMRVAGEKVAAIARATGGYRGRRFTTCWATATLACPRDDELRRSLWGRRFFGMPSMFHSLGVKVPYPT